MTRREIKDDEKGFATRTAAMPMNYGQCRRHAASAVRLFSLAISRSRYGNDLKANAMDTTSLMLSLLFGCVGLGFFMYGKKAAQIVPIGAGVALMVCPYFITNLVLLLVVCLVLTVVPFVWRSE